MNGGANVRQRAPLVPVVALTVAASVAGFGLLAALTHWAIAPTELPPPFTEQNQDAETALFVLTFALALPLAFLVTPRLADRVAAGPNAALLPALAAGSTALLLAEILVVRLSEDILPFGHGGLTALFVASLVWLAITAGALAFAAGDRELSPSLARAARPLSALAVVLALGLVAAFADLDSLTVLPFLLGLLVAVGVAAAADVELPSLPRRAGIAWDVVAVVLLLLAVPNLVVFFPENPALATETLTTQFHQNFFLGPANQVLGGGAMLVDTLSQYGVTSIYFLDLAFLVIPISNGTLGLIEGVLAAGVFAIAYLTIRGAGVGRLLASVAMAIGVVVLVLNLLYPIGALLQHGAFRFGLPIPLIAAAVLEARRPDRATLARAVQIATIALSATWALEGFAYSLITFAGIVAFEVATKPEGRLRLLGVRVAQAAAAIVVAHVVFALATLIFAGQLPEWGRYLETLRAFLTGGIGDLTYDFTRWSAGFATGAVLLASTGGIALAVRRRPDLVAADRPAYMALAGFTAYGIALFSYFVNRSADHILPYVSLPVLAVLTLWLSLLLRSPQGTGVVRRVALGGAAALTAFLVAIAWSNAGDRFRQSALSHLIPGGESTRAALERLEDPPELSPGAREGDRLLEKWMPDEHTSMVMTSADVGMEILMETGRVNRLPLANPWEDSFVYDLHIDAVRETIDGLEEGDLMLVDRPARQIIAGYERDPLTGDLDNPQTIVPTGMALLQREALREINELFTLRTLERGGQGIEVVELVAREPGDVPGPDPEQQEDQSG